MTNTEKNIVGITSLVMALLALAVPYLIQRPFTKTEPFPFTLLYIYDNRLFYMFAGVGFVMGIVGLRSRYGRVGFIITAIALGFVMCCWVFTLLYTWYTGVTG